MNHTISDDHQPSIARILASLLQADFAVMIRNRRALALGMVLPLVILMMSKRAAVLGDSFLLAESITVGLVSMAILGYSMSTARDREKGIFQRLRVTPAPSWAIMVSRITVQVTACLAMVVVVLLAGYEIERISLPPAGYALTVPVALVGAAVFLSIGQALVGLIRSADTINALGRIVYIAIIFLGLLGEAGRFGETLQTVATWSPYGTVTTLLDGAMNASGWTGSTWLALVVSAAYVLAFAGIGIRWFHWNPGA